MQLSARAIVSTSMMDILPQMSVCSILFAEAMNMEMSGIFPAS